MAVRVRQHQVVLRDHAMAHNLIRSRRPPENEKGPVRAEDARRIALGVARGADVVEPGAERRGRDAEVRPEQVFAKKLVELHADRVFEVGDAAHVARRIPGVGALVGVALQLLEVRRQQLLVVALDCEVHAVRDKGRRITEQVDVLVHLPDDFQRQL